LDAVVSYAGHDREEANAHAQKTTAKGNERELAFMKSKRTEAKANGATVT
jgi:hypothetical protein